MSGHSNGSPSRKSAKDAEEIRLARELMTELVKIRKKRKIAQQGIADAIGVTQGRVSQMENSPNGDLKMKAVLVYAKTIGAVIMVMPAGDNKTEEV